MRTAGKNGKLSQHVFVLGSWGRDKTEMRLKAVMAVTTAQCVDLNETMVIYDISCSDTDHSSLEGGCSTCRADVLLPSSQWLLNKLEEGKEHSIFIPGF